MGVRSRTRGMIAAVASVALLAGVIVATPVDSASATKVPTSSDGSTAGAESSTFSDVGSSTPFAREILWLSSSGIANGFSDGTFRPQAPVNRDAMAAFLYRLAGSPPYTPPSLSPFSDVTTNTPFYKEITWLASTGITTGFSDGTFRPLQSVNRDAMAAFMYRFDGQPAFTPSGTSPFFDVPTSYPFYKQIAWLASEGISTGSDAGGGCRRFAPLESVNRDAMAAFMYRLELGGTTPLESGTCLSRAASQTDLTNKLTARIASLPGTYSVSVRQVTGVQAAVNIRGATMQEPASVMKLFAVYGVLKRIDQGRFGLGTATRSGVSVRDCIRVTLHISDNLCHWDLVAMVGEQNLNNLFAAEGFSRTVYAGRDASGRLWNSKHTTTGDLALLLDRLERGTLLGAASTKLFIDTLETQLWRDRIPHGTPPGTPVANKTGQLWTSTGMLEGDAGIVTGAKHTYTIAVLGSRNATPAGIAAISRVVYEHFHGTFGTAASYTKLNLVTTSTVTAYQYAGTGATRTVAAGTRVHADYSARLWYRVILGGTTVVYIHSSQLANWLDYPRRG